MESEEYYNFSWGGLISIIGIIFLVSMSLYIYFDMKNDIKEQKINFDIGETRATIINEEGLEISQEGFILGIEELKIIEIRVPTPDKIGVYQLCMEHNLKKVKPALADETSPINFVKDQIHNESNRFNCALITILPYHLEKGYYETFWEFRQKQNIQSNEQIIYIYFEQEPTIIVYTQDKMQTSNTSGGARYYIPNGE